ncbi:hypothetical protein PHMEG_0005236 [Phytophthora megakarya]|uniref:Uncharacterized protein n=1 Tax=Phytophthora megakarya TaxID=4795 RepID=A0A225WRU2_9STRA|nr:hypothetical protein PHMEG_0005236 [Phytophthora megakarya]
MYSKKTALTGIAATLIRGRTLIPPVGLDLIYIDPRNKQKLSTVDIEGFLLRRRFNVVIALEESVRLVMIRNGAEDVQRLDWEATKDHENDWSADAAFVLPDNATRTAINNGFVTAAAKRLPAGLYPCWVVENFKGALSGLSRRDVEYMMGLSDTRFAGMARSVDLVKGMPIQITQNVRPTKGAANGKLWFLESFNLSTIAKLGSRINFQGSRLSVQYFESTKGQMLFHSILAQIMHFSQFFVTPKRSRKQKYRCREHQMGTNDRYLCDYNISLSFLQWEISCRYRKQAPRNVFTRFAGRLTERICYFDAIYE